MNGTFILYVGTTWYGSTTAQRKRALEDIGCTIDTVDTGWRQELPTIGRRIVRSFFRRTGYPLEMKDENRKIIDAVSQKRYDIVWIDKGLTIRPKTLDFIRNRQPQTVILSFSVDDMINPDNQSRYYLKSVPRYDLHVTTKTPNVLELKDMGAKHLFYIENGYDLHVHRPVEITEEDQKKYGADVGFVGGYEKARAESLLRLAEAGISIRVWGNRWYMLKNRPTILRIEDRPVFGDEYAKVLCATKINLAFLRKINRDQQTTRSIEIPACGAFMLAERTKEHQKLFKENEEAVFFETDEELIEKIRHFLKATDERKRIARAGYTRCLENGYSNQKRLKPVLEECNKIQTVKMQISVT
ncbi:glycosyltransferase [Thermodesulfobacteriota bacterium]